MTTIKNVCLATLLTAAVWAPPAVAQLNVGASAIGIEAGLPLVLGLDASYRINPRWRVGVGFGKLSGLTALRAEARWLVRNEVRTSVVPSLIAGAEQYFLDDEGKEASPLGIHAGIGLDYYLESPVSVGIRIGVLKTFGSSDGDGAKVFSVKNDFTTGTFNMGVRYHF